LGKTRFEREVPSGNERVRVFRFRSVDSACRYVDVLWCPTSDQSQVRRYSLDVGTADRVTLVTLGPDSVTGHTRQLTPRYGYVDIDVSERPVFVVVP
jgi:hypothetical protein